MAIGPFRWMTALLGRAVSNLITSGPANLLAWSTASRRLPAPLSAVVVTTNAAGTSRDSRDCTSSCERGAAGFFGTDSRLRRKKDLIDRTSWKKCCKSKGGRPSHIGQQREAGVKRKVGEIGRHRKALSAI